MATVKAHYQSLLAEIYSWMYGGLEQGIAMNLEFFTQHHIKPHSSGMAVDLGSGSGFQSIPLAQLGFSVLAIDSDRQLLTELNNNSGELDISTVEDDLLRFPRHLREQAELIVCMTDTLLHLETKEQVIILFEEAFAKLAAKGNLILTFRDLSSELSELDRFIPVRSDAETVLTCFLEYEPETVKVHDLVYQLQEGNWTFNKSFYRKLRLSGDWVENQLTQAGFNQIESNRDRGMVTIIATK